MRKAAYIAGVTGLIVFIMGPVFALHHLAGTSQVLAWGTLFNEVIVLPVIAIYLLRSKHSGIYLFVVLSLFFLIAGLFSKIQHWPASFEITALGALLFCVSTVLLATHLYKQTAKQDGLH